MLMTSRLVKKVQRSLGGAVFGYCPLRISPQKDSEEYLPDVPGAYDPYQDFGFVRSIPASQQRLLWRLYTGEFLPPRALTIHYSNFSESYVEMVCCAVEVDGEISSRRFRFANALANVLDDGRAEVYAVDLSSNRVFELRGSHLKYWHSPEKAVETLASKSEWWREWTAEDDEYVDAVFK